jgi:metallo-beta-lactamase family protein
MDIQFLGAVRTVTGSRHLLELNGDRVLFDCGLFQGRRQQSRERNSSFRFDPRSITSVVLSHAHIDHSGNLPSLYKRGYPGVVYTTLATRDLCKVMLLDSAHIQQRDAEYLNRKRKRGQKPIEPLYEEDDAKLAVRQMQGYPYHYPVVVGRGATATFYDAGHILGSALTLLEAEEAGRKIRIAFTFDLGRRDMPILRDPEPLPPVDYIITESTYGDRLHEPAGDMKQRLKEVLRRTFDRGGRVVVPAFSVGRTQNLVYYLHELFNEGNLPPIPIFIDSPLSVNATAAYRGHPECYDEETKDFLEREEDPFGFRRLRYIKDVEESKALNHLDKPCVIISASGMCEAGRILHHLKHSVTDPRNTILIVGFQAPHTLGKRLVDRVKGVKIYGKTYKLRAEVVTMNGFSAHADWKEILGYLGPWSATAKGVFIVHGDEDQALALQRRLAGAGFRNVAVPVEGEKFEL